jgi:hypothetical protein
MRTVALRFAENFAPECGTIEAHRQVIEGYGSVWYGKFGAAVSEANVRALLANDDPKILLIHSGGSDRWWAHVDAVQRSIPDDGHYPAYYAQHLGKFHCWFHVTGIEPAPRDVMRRCVVPSSGKPLTQASRYSMSPYFVIDYLEG